MTRYCSHCKVQIEFTDDDTNCPICSRETEPDTDEIRVQRVRATMIKAQNKKEDYHGSRI